MSEIKAPVNIKTPVTAAPVSEAAAASNEELSADALARKESLIRLQTEELRLERERLTLKKLRRDIELMDAQDAKQSMSHETVEEALKFANDDRRWHEENCTHMKGGSSESLLNNAPSQGQDATNYAMIQHTLTTGVTFRLCQRCGRTWYPKDPDYRWAMSRPTKNSPSTGCPSPGLVRNRKSTAEGGVRLESEISHRVQPMQQPDFSQANVQF